MTNLEAQQIIDQELKPRWPKWNPTGIETSDWAYILREKSHLLAKEACRETKMKSKYNSSPVLSEFECIYSEMRELQKKTQEPKVKGDKKTYVPAWIVCVYVPDDGCGRRWRNTPGRRFELGFDVKECLDDAAMQRGCERYADSIRDTYGPGVFESYIGEENHHRAMQRSVELAGAILTIKDNVTPDWDAN